MSERKYVVVNITARKNGIEDVYRFENEVEAMPFAEKYRWLFNSEIVFEGEVLYQVNYECIVNVKEKTKIYF